MPTTLLPTSPGFADLPTAQHSAEEKRQIGQKGADMYSE